MAWVLLYYSYSVLVLLMALCRQGWFHWPAQRAFGAIKARQGSVRRRPDGSFARPSNAIPCRRHCGFGLHPLTPLVAILVVICRQLIRTRLGESIPIPRSCDLLGKTQLGTVERLSQGWPDAVAFWGLAFTLISTRKRSPRSLRFLPRRLERCCSVAMGRRRGLSGVWERQGEHGRDFECSVTRFCDGFWDPEDTLYSCHFGR